MRAPLCLGIDTSTRPSPGQPEKLRAAGVSIVLGYLGAETHPHWRKTLRRQDVDAYHAAGIGVGLIWESAPTKATYFTVQQGAADATHAAVEAGALGAPDGRTLWATCDYDARPPDYAAIDDYATAYDRGLGSQYDSGLYAHADVVDHVYGGGTVGEGWTTYAWRHRCANGSSIYQYENGAMVVGMPCDLDAVYDTAGLWLPRGWTPAPWPAWAPKPGGDAVANVNELTADQARQLQKLLVDLGANIAVDGKCGPATKAALATAKVPQADPDAARNAKIADLARQFVAAATD